MGEWRLIWLTILCAAILSALPLCLFRSPPTRARLPPAPAPVSTVTRSPEVIDAWLMRPGASARLVSSPAPEPRR